MLLPWIRKQDNQEYFEQLKKSSFIVYNEILSTRNLSVVTTDVGFKGAGRVGIYDF